MQPVDLTDQCEVNVGFGLLAKQVDPVDTGLMDQSVRLAIVQTASREVGCSI
jgi:hypothetical protein